MGSTNIDVLLVDRLLQRRSFLINRSSLHSFGHLFDGILCLLG